MSQYPGIDYLKSLAHTEGGRDFGLETPRKLLQQLGNPQDAIPAVHVAGTNGKGSVCAVTSAMLIAAGYSVGQFTSPHLFRVNERCVVNGKPIEDDELDRALQTVRDAADKVGITPSFFELVTAASFLVFAEKKLERLVIEVGLGGRLDATNLISRPIATVITGIALDHVEILGDTLPKIAREKAGILKTGSPAFVGIVAEEVRGEICRVAATVDVKPEFQEQDFSWSCGKLISRDGEIGLDLTRRALRGQYQELNGVLAARVCQAIGISADDIQRGLEIVRWPGRLELITSVSGARFLLDAAHNLEGVRALAAYLQYALGAELKGVTKLNVVLGVLERKQWKEMLRELSTSLTQQAREFGFQLSFLLTASDHPLSVKPTELVNYLGAGTPLADPRSWLLKQTETATPTSLTIIAGSIYLLGSLRPVLTEHFSTLK